MHPDYIGDAKVLDAPMSMAPDGLFLYQRIVAAAKLRKYMDLCVPACMTKAEELRGAILKLREHALSKRADRFKLPGVDGYPHEVDFSYIATASGISFVVDLGAPPVPR